MNVAGFVVATAPNNKSPFAVVVALPLFGELLLAVAAAVTSRELEVASPEYSRIAKRSGPETVIDTVTVFAPLGIFSA